MEWREFSLVSDRESAIDIINIVLVLNCGFCCCVAYVRFKPITLTHLHNKRSWDMLSHNKKNVNRLRYANLIAKNHLIGEGEKRLLLCASPLSFQHDIYAIILKCRSKLYSWIVMHVFFFILHPLPLHVNKQKGLTSFFSLSLDFYWVIPRNDFTALNGKSTSCLVTFFFLPSLKNFLFCFP